MSETKSGFWYADWSFPIFVGLLSSGVFAGTHMYYEGESSQAPVFLFF